MQIIPPFVLASGSPRRKELLQEAGFAFTVGRINVAESIPPSLSPLAVANHLARKKLAACGEWLNRQLVVTADTLVYCDDKIMGKPADKTQAIAMLQALAGGMHQVTTSVCLGYQQQVHQFSVTTKVYFAPLSEAEIDFYVMQYQPFDKAGSYGIQEWIGLTGITKIVGSYTNVVGLPMHETYRALIEYSHKWLA